MVEAPYQQMKMLPTPEIEAMEAVPCQMTRAMEEVPYHQQTQEAARYWTALPLVHAYLELRRLSLCRPRKLKVMLLQQLYSRDGEYDRLVLNGLLAGYSGYVCA